VVQGKESACAGHVRANREIALFSHIFNSARESGLTKAPNPCLDVKKNMENGRDVYVEDDLFARVYGHADQPIIMPSTGKRIRKTGSLSADWTLCTTFDSHTDYATSGFWYRLRPDTGRSLGWNRQGSLRRHETWRDRVTPRLRGTSESSASGHCKSTRIPSNS
jgi:hypothetical protein